MMSPLEALLLVLIGAGFLLCAILAATHRTAMIKTQNRLDRLEMLQLRDASDIRKLRYTTVDAYPSKEEVFVEELANKLKYNTCYDVQDLIIEIEELAEKHFITALKEAYKNGTDT